MEGLGGNLQAGHVFLYEGHGERGDMGSGATVFRHNTPHWTKQWERECEESLKRGGKWWDV